MRYAIVIAGAFVREAQEINTVWDDTHYCTPSHLTQDERLQFNVAPVVQTTRPAFDPDTQTIVEQPPTFDGTNWNQVWQVVALDAESIAVNRAVKQYATDAAIVRADPKLRALVTMTPAALKTWVAAHVTNLAQAQDAIATLAIAVGILARRI